MYLPGETRLYAYTPTDETLETPDVVRAIQRLLEEQGDNVANTDTCIDAVLSNPFEGSPSPFEGSPSPFEGSPSPDPGASDCWPSPATVPAGTLTDQPALDRNGWKTANELGVSETGAGVTVVVIDCFPVDGDKIDVGGTYLDYLVLMDLDEEHTSMERVVLETGCRYSRLPAPPDYEPPDGVPTHDDLLKYHGTMVASLIHSMAPDVRIIGVRAINNNGVTYSTDLIRAIEWIMQNPIVDGTPLLLDPNRVVFNLSLGLQRTQNETVESCCTFRAVNEATIQRAWLVCAAGNDSYIRPENPTEPAAYGHYWHSRATDGRVIAAGGTSISTKFAGYSNESYFGAPANCVVMDPDSVSSSMLSGSFVRWHGTSFATPQITALVALLLSSSSRPKRVKQHIFETAHPPGRWDGVREICVSNALAGVPCDGESSAGCFATLLRAIAKSIRG